MSNEIIILFATTHEQSLPTFHVRADLITEFMWILNNRGFISTEPPKKLPGKPMMEVLLEAGTPLDKLESVKDMFIASIKK